MIKFTEASGLKTLANGKKNKTYNGLYVDKGNGMWERKGTHAGNRGNLGVHFLLGDLLNVCLHCEDEVRQLFVMFPDGQWARVDQGRILACDCPLEKGFEKLRKCLPKSF